MRIILISDFDMRGSGYFHIATNVGIELDKLGYKDIKALGLGYKHEQHDFPFTIIPSSTLDECHVQFHNLMSVWKPDVVIIALDLPLQMQFMKRFEQYGVPHIGIFPIEADPLCMSWAIGIMGMRKAFIISKFGTEEAKKKGVINCEYFPIGLDMQSWRIPTQEEREKLRKSMNIENAFVVLTVADNQERKNLSASMQMMKQFIHENPHADIRYFMVTREFFEYGWKLRELSEDLGISNRLSIFERGLSFSELWALYAVSDAFLLTSKAEGAGIPILEAMSCGVPVVGTMCTAILDHIGKWDERGYGVDYDYQYIDPFGNGNRYMASIPSGIGALQEVYDRIDLERAVSAARKYIEDEMQWSVSIPLLDEELRKLENEKKTPEAKS